jgi:DNA-directed RNA polymerase subunit RPC12/RpoP
MSEAHFKNGKWKNPQGKTTKLENPEWKNRIIVLKCTLCGHKTTDPKMKGNGWIEIILWLCYIVPGLIYSIWRRSGTQNICPICDKDTLIPMPLTNPEDEEIIDQQAVRDEIECPWCAETILAKAKLCKHCGKDVVNI